MPDIVRRIMHRRRMGETDAEDEKRSENQRGESGRDTRRCFGLGDAIGRCSHINLRDGREIAAVSKAGRSPGSRVFSRRLAFPKPKLQWLSDPSADAGDIVGTGRR